MKYIVTAVIIALILILSWKLVDKNHKSGLSFQHWHSSNFDISSDKAKARAIEDASDSEQPKTKDSNKHID
jgi:hypothetical protein